jgi:hypothetical protein
VFLPITRECNLSNTNITFIAAGIASGLAAVLPVCFNLSVSTYLLQPACFSLLASAFSLQPALLQPGCLR